LLQKTHRLLDAWLGEGIVPVRRGRKIAIPKIGGAACACRALRAWLDRAGITAGAIFRPIDRHGNVRERRLSGYAVGAIVKRYVERIGMDPTLYAGHSLRAGLVTSAARAGAAAWQIKNQTGHRSEAMLAGYIRDGDGFANKVAGLIFRKYRGRGSEKRRIGGR
jgi:integrase